MSTPEIETWMVDAAKEIIEGVSASLAIIHQGRIADEFDAAAIIARHAPAQGVNEGLLAAAREVMKWEPPLSAVERLGAAIASAQSAPASLERELAEALRNTMLELVHAKRFHESKPSEMVIAEARAVLRKYDEAHATPPLAPAPD